MTSRAEQRALTGTQEKKRIYGLLQKGQETQEDYRDVMWLYREKIRKTKAQLELNWASPIKEKSKCFYKYISN